MRRSIAIGLFMAFLIGPAPVFGQQRSLVVGIDGFGYGTQGFDVASTPWMDSLIDGTWATVYHGAYSDQAFAGGVPGTPTQQVTSSGPGWSTFLTGVWKDQHLVSDNGFSPQDYVNNPPYLKTLEENLPNIYSASIINRTPIDTHITAVDTGGTAMDFRSTPGGDANVTSVTASRIAGLNDTDPAAIYIHWDEVDYAGHNFGSSGVEYGTEIEEKDEQVGQLLNAISGRPNFANEEWQIIISADHGHKPGGGHGGDSDLERTVPFIVASQSLNQGNLPLNFPQEVSIADVAPTVLDHFDIPLPEHYWGVSRAQGAVTINPDINGDGIVSGNGAGEYGDDDVVAFVSHWLQPNTAENSNPADLNLDGIADIGDWVILNAELPEMGGAVANALSGTNVPEPPTLLLVLLTLATVCVARRRH